MSGEIYTHTLTTAKASPQPVCESDSSMTTNLPALPAFSLLSTIA